MVMILENRIVDIFEGDNGLFKDENTFDVHYVQEKFFFGIIK